MLSSSNSKIIDDRWIFVVKKNANDNIVKWKIKWMIKNFRQLIKINYFEIYFEIIKIVI